jgi:hypothetical protein
LGFDTQTAGGRKEGERLGAPAAVGCADVNNASERNLAGFEAAQRVGQGGPDSFLLLNNLQSALFKKVPDYFSTHASPYGSYRPRNWQIGGK